MKRLISLAITILFVFSFATGAFAQESVLKIASLEGKVLVKSASSKDWVEAKVGQAIDKDDTIRTEADGKVYLEFPDKSAFSLKPNSELLVEDIIWDATARKVSVNLNAGELKTIIKKVDTPSEFKVETPTAICGAYGTIFYTIAKAAKTHAYSEEDRIYFTLKKNNKTIYLDEGMESDAEGDNISDPANADPEDVKDMTGGYLEPAVAEPYIEPGGETAADTVPASAEVTEENTPSPI